MPKRDDFFTLSPFPFIIEELALMQIPVITDIPLNKTQKEGVFTYPNISLPQFVRQIELANAAIAPDYRRQLSVKQDNFATAFTEHETQVIEHLLARE
jgi:hypothetical protein